MVEVSLLRESIPERLRESIPESEKFYLESMLYRDPDNVALLDAYFSMLSAMSRCSFGLSYASLPGYPSPLFFRSMTSDIFNLQQIFRDKEYGFEFNQPPRRILDLGAYAGYAAIYLANRFPSAEIVSVEPSSSNFRLLNMNTAPYEQIRTLHGAVWHRSAKLKLINQIEGDWGNVFGEQNYDAEHTVQAYTVEEILRSVGWPSADYVKCDIEGAELEIFSDPSATAWLQNVSSISVETHDRFKPGCTEAVERALPPSRYMHRQSGEFHVFTRSTADCDAAPLSALSADLILLVPRTLRLRRFDLINIPPDAWGFCTIDDETFQLHPRPPGQGRSEIQFHLNLSGQCRFSAQCHLPAKSEWPVIFSARLIGGDRTDLDKARTVSPGETTELRFDIPRTEGQCRVALGTEMSPEASTNGFAWAQWKRPCLE